MDNFSKMRAVWEMTSAQFERHISTADACVHAEGASQNSCLSVPLTDNPSSLSDSAATSCNAPATNGIGDFFTDMLILNPTVGASGDCDAAACRGGESVEGLGFLLLGDANEQDAYAEAQKQRQTALCVLADSTSMPAPFSNQ